MEVTGECVLHPTGFTWNSVQPDSEYGLLTRLANLYGTDKGTLHGAHGYTVVYEAFMRPRRLKVQRVLEIGVAAGASLKMWRDYFVSAQIHGVDLVSIPSVFGDRVTLHVLDQEDEAGLERLGKEFGPFDLVVDDGGHTMKQQQTSFKVLEKYVTKDGLYVVEDLHSSFCGKPYGVEKAEDTTLAVLARLREALIFSSASSGSIVGIVRRGQ